MTKPNINVTPLIDVLLVLLIIFMVVAPLKPSVFKAKIPAEPRDNATVNTHPLTLVVAIGSDSSLRVNDETGVGTADEPEKAIAKLKDIFQKRLENGAYSENGMNDGNLPTDERIEKTVFIKAPRKLDYGKVAKVIDAVKQSGARPISLQIDDLQ